MRNNLKGLYLGGLIKYIVIYFYAYPIVVKYLFTLINTW